MFFFYFRSQKLKISQISDGHLLELLKYYLLCVFCNSLDKRIFDEFVNIYLFRTKIAGGNVTKSALSQNVFARIGFFFTRRRIDVRRVMPSFMSISGRVQELFRKKRGGDTPPQAVKG